MRSRRNGAVFCWIPRCSGRGNEPPLGLSLRRVKAENSLLRCHVIRLQREENEMIRVYRFCWSTSAKPVSCLWMRMLSSTWGCHEHFDDTRYTIQIYLTCYCCEVLHGIADSLAPRHACWHDREHTEILNAWRNLLPGFPWYRNGRLRNRCWEYLSHRQV